MSAREGGLVTDEMVEAAAEALCMADRTHGWDWPDISERDRIYYRADARAALEAAAPLIAGRALKQAADDWQTGEWANAPRKADRVADRLGAAQHVCDWLRTRAEKSEQEARA